MTDKEAVSSELESGKGHEEGEPTMGMRTALSEETPVKAVLKRAIEIGLGLFVAGWMGHGLIEQQVAAIKADCAKEISDLRLELKQDIEDGIARERDRNEILYQHRGGR